MNDACRHPFVHLSIATLTPRSVLCLAWWRQGCEVGALTEELHRTAVDLVHGLLNTAPALTQVDPTPIRPHPYTRP